MGKPIFIVEDERSISDALAYALRSEGFSAQCFETGAAALAAFSKESPDFVILDIGLPDMSGFELCKRLRLTSSVPILFLTARAEEIDRVLGFELGGDDYMTKPFSPRELVARVKAILRRSAQEVSAPAPTSVSRAFVINEETLVVTYRGKPLDLSRYEFRLLSVLVRRPGRVYSREELMDRAWESPEMSLERTVDTHIKTIRAKLRAITPDHDPIVTHRGFGYSLREDA